MTEPTRVALVTGATGGIGRAVVEALSEHGQAVVATDVDEQVLHDQAQVWAVRGWEVRTVAADLTDPAGIARVVESAATGFGRLDVLVNNAGVTAPSRIERMSDEQWDHVLEVNLGAVFRLCRAAADLLGTRPPYPPYHRKVVNVASTNGIYGQSHNVNYSASKAGLVGFTRALAREWAPARVNVNAVAPGFIADTGMTRESDDPRSGLPSKTLDALVAGMPLGRAGHPDDVAGTIRFLTSSDSDFMTGQVLELHGGKEILSVVGS